MFRKLVQPRLLVPSLARNCTCFRPVDGQKYYRKLQDRFGLPRHSDDVLDVLKYIRSLSEDEKLKYRYVFSEVLGLPKPPMISTQGEGEKFAVKLIKIGKGNEVNVRDAIVSIKTREAPSSVSDFAMGSIRILGNLPSVVKQGVTKEEAMEIVSKIKAAGGEAVMRETLE